MHRILQSCLPDTLVLILHMPSSLLLSKPVYPSSGKDMPWKIDLEILALPWPGKRLSLRLTHQALVSLIHMNLFSQDSHISLCHASVRVDQEICCFP